MAYVRRHGNSNVTSRLSQLTSHLVVALVVLVGIGGATRVMDAGLACPDWPLCYGTLLPGPQMNLQVFLEWFHRLDAFVVGVAVAVLAGTSLVARRSLPGWLPPVALGLVALVLIQASLGALTVVALLPPWVVTAHLMAALVLVALASGCHQRLFRLSRADDARGLAHGSSHGLPASPAWMSGLGDALDQPPPWWRALCCLALVAVLGQCLLGGLMASQWASGRCLASGLGCGWLLAHRLSASVAAAAVTTPLIALVRPSAWLSRQMPLVVAASGLVVVQMLLGRFAMALALTQPLITVAHQLCAALLVALLAALVGRSWPLGAMPATVLSPGREPLEPKPAVEVAHG